MPIFSSTAARTAEPAAGASVWAGGSHVWNGHTGVLIASPTPITTSVSTPATPRSASGSAASRAGMSKVTERPATAREMNPSSMTSEPRKV